MNRPRLASCGASSLAVIVTAWIALSAASAPVLPDPGNAGVSKADQLKLGRDAMAEVYKQMPVLPDSSPDTRYVRRLGEKLAAVIPAENSWPWEFHIVAQKEINAFALPGGPMFVNVGTITAAQNEAQLAGVMAHEMAHVYMQHSVKQMKKNTAPSLLAGLGQIAGQIIGGFGGELTGQLTKIGGGMWSMKYSRTDEAQADSVGAIIMYNAGYDPRALADFFKQLAAQGGNPPQILSDHPNPGNREAALGQQVASWPPKRYAASSAAFARAQEDAKSVTVYTAQEIDAGAKSGLWARQNTSSGATPADLASAPASPGIGVPEIGAAPSAYYSRVKPSGLFRPLTRNGVSLFYPENWQALGRESDSGTTIAPAAGVVDGNLAYGVIVTKGRDPGARTIDEALRHVVEAMQKSNPGMRAAGPSRAITVNGLAGVTVDLMAESPIVTNGRRLRERDWMVMFPDTSVDNGFIYLVFVAPESDFEELRPTYESVLRAVSFR